MTTPVLIPQDLEELVQTGLSIDVLQDAIDREVAALEHDLGGPLTGERTDTLYPRAGTDGPLWLRRYTSAVEVTDAGAEVTVRLIEGGGAIERSTGTWTGPVAITYTPSDELRARTALIELVRNAVVPDRNREVGQARSGAAEDDERARRWRFVRSLKPRPGSGTIRVRGSREPDRITAVGT